MTDPKSARSRTLRWILVILAVGLVVVAALGWLNRRIIAREALTSWLTSRGLISEARVEAVGPTTFAARLRIGDSKAPDFTSERVEVRYRLKISGAEIVSVRLARPILRASYRGGKFSAGALDPLIREFLSHPPPPGAKLPRVQVDDGALLLATDHGALRVVGDVLFDDQRLQRLNATLDPVRLKGPDFEAALGRTAFTATTHGKRLQLALNAPVAEGNAAGVDFSGALLTLSAQLPYPDLTGRRIEGAVNARATLAGRTLSMADRGLVGPNLSTTFAGDAKGGLSDLLVVGRGGVALSAPSGQIGGAVFGGLRIEAGSTDLIWTRKGGDRLAATLVMTGEAQRAGTSGLKLSALTAAATGPVVLQRTSVTADLNGRVSGHGQWSALGPALAADSADLAAVKRAARSFDLAAPGISIRVGNGVRVRLAQPVVLSSAGGGRIALSASRDAPVFDSGVGAFRLAVSGGGLPRAAVDIDRLTLSQDGASATGSLRAQASVGLVEGAEIHARGRVDVANGGLTFIAQRCVSLKARRLEFGANDIDDLSGRFCPTAMPLFRYRNGDWQLAGRGEAFSAVAPFAQVRVSGAASMVRAASVGGRLSSQARITSARVNDTTPAARFSPLELTGGVTFNDFLWKADLAARRPGGTVIGRASIAHDTALGIGLAVLDSDTLTFAEGGLQPVQLSPLAAALGPPVVGSVHFKGRFDWAREGASSSGLLSVPSLSFQSAAGPVEGLKGEIAFVSLAPLVAAPGQDLEIARVSAIVPLTALRARFGLADNLLKIEGGEADVGGGHVRVETLEYPLTPGAPSRGVLIFDGVQLHDIVEASPFGDKVDLDAKVSGRMAFEANGNRVRIAGGELRADQPGRISIDRAALTGVQAEGAVAAPGAVAAALNANDTFTDFAYQAMQNLAFDKLDATVASRSDGRLGVLFHIVGRHDPPTKQTIRLSVIDLLQKRFLGRKLPLPSGTGVNLTLDTTLNLDDLLADYADYLRARSSAAVQP